MTQEFEPLSKPRFKVESKEGFERIVIPAAKSWFALLFLVVWLTGWTFAGIAAIAEAFSGRDTGFLIAWLCGWTLGWLFAGSWIGWQVSGKEILAVQGEALVRGWSIFSVERLKRYDLAHVEDLSTTTPSLPYGAMRLSYPPFFPLPMGPLKWNYGAATVYAAAGLTEAEAKLIAERLRARMPARLKT